MNEQNFEYLKDQVKYMGFGEKLYDELQKQVQGEAPNFSIRHEAEFEPGKKMTSDLHFRRSDQGMVFFNSYDAKLLTETGAKQQTFYLNNNSGVTCKEAFNLLEGRAVYKELTNREDQKYHAWLQMDLQQKDEKGQYPVKQFHDNYGFDVRGAADRLPIRTGEDSERMIRALEKGNLVTAVLENGRAIKIAADPQFKSVEMYEAGGRVIKGKEREQILAMKTDAKPEQKNELKNEVKADRKQSQSVVADEGGIEKKRVKQKVR